jgi:cytochrome c-type biogenesis protein CcmH/NrfG
MRGGNVPEASDMSQDQDPVTADPGTNPISIRDPLERARAEEALGRYLLAAAAYSEAARLTPDDPSPLIGQARSLHAAGFPGEARRVIDDALREHPEAPEFLLMAGEDELLAGRPARAIWFFRRVLDVRPESRNGELRLAVARILHDRGTARGQAFSASSRDS